MVSLISRAFIRSCRRSLRRLRTVRRVLTSRPGRPSTLSAACVRGGQAGGTPTPSRYGAADRDPGLAGQRGRAAARPGPGARPVLRQRRRPSGVTWPVDQLAPAPAGQRAASRRTSAGPAPRRRPAARRLAGPADAGPHHRTPRPRRTPPRAWATQRPLGRGVGERLDRRQLAGRDEQARSPSAPSPRTTSVTTATEAYGSSAQSVTGRQPAATPAAAGRSRGAGVASTTASASISSGDAAGPVVSANPPPGRRSHGSDGRRRAQLDPAPAQVRDQGVDEPGTPRRPARRTPARASDRAQPARACCSSEPPARAPREQPGRDRVEGQLPGSSRVHAAEQRLEQPVGHLGPEALVDVRRRWPRRRPAAAAAARFVGSARA